jgi:predicted GTPase
MLSQLAARALQSPSLTIVARRALLPCVTTMPSRMAVLSRRFASKSEPSKENVIILGAAGSDSQPSKENVIILGAAGRDFHDFITYWSTVPNADVKCFTGAQIPGIDRRVFPREMCNNDKNFNKYPNGLKIYPESSLEDLVERLDADTVALAYSDLSYDIVQSLASRANAAGCKFVQLPPKLTMVESTKPIVSVCASRTGVGKSQTSRYVAKVSPHRCSRPLLD